jgi:hypothetical protein
MIDPLRHELAHHEYLLERLRKDFPDADEETLLDTASGETNLTDMLGVVLRSMLDDKAIVAALRERRSDMQARLERLEHRAEAKRDLVIEVMERAGLKKLAEADFTASLRAGRPPIVLIDEAAVPGDYWRPQPAKLDKQQLYSALRDGRDIPGAVLGNGEPTIAVRTR